MAMELVILDGVDVVAQSLNAIAAFVNNETWSSILKIAEYIGIIAAAITYVKGQDLRTFFYWFLAFVLINSILLTPKERVVIRDLANPTVVKQVDNVPLGVAFPLYFTTKIGYAIAQTYDTFFSQPNDVQYTKTGLLFGQRLLEESFYLRPSDKILANNLNHYIQSCVVERNMIKGANTFEALMDNKELVNTLYAGSASDYVQFSQGGSSRLESCAVAGRAIATDMNRVSASTMPIASMMSNLGLKSGNPAILHEYKNKISDVQRYFMGSSKAASEIYTQNMLVNAYRRALERYPASLDGSAELIAQASEQSLTKMKLAHLSSYQVAGKTLPALHTVFLVLMIGIFPIMVMAMFIREFTFGVIKNYVSILCSLMMWPVLFAVFNSIIATLTSQVMGGRAFTLSSMDTVKEAATTVAGIASWLMLAIPFLSFKLTTNLGQTIANAGSYLGNALSSSTSADAANTAAGNYNWANMQMNNINGNKVDLNNVYRSGMRTVQLENGATQTITSDGSMVLDSSGAISKLPFSFDSGRMLDASLNSSIQALHRQSEQFMQGYRSSITNAHDSASQILQNYSHQDLMQKGLTETDINALKKTAQESFGANLANSSTDSTSSSESKSTSSSFGGGVNAGISGRGVGGSLNYGISNSNSINSSKANGSKFDYIHNEQYTNSELAENTQQLSQINTSQIQDSQLRSLVESTQNSMRNAQESFSGFTATQSRERVLSETANLTESQRLNIQHNLVQEFLGFARQRLGDENVGRVLTDGTREAREIRTQLLNEFAGEFEASLRDIHNGNGLRVLGSQEGLQISSSASNSDFSSQALRDEAERLGINMDGIEKVDPYSERNQDVKIGYAVKSGKNKVMINESEDFANNRENANKNTFKRKF